jgi:hypothetical protein
MPGRFFEPAGVFTAYWLTPESVLLLARQTRTVEGGRAEVAKDVEWSGPAHPCFRRLLWTAVRQT